MNIVECEAVMDRLRRLFPTLTGDAERQAEIERNLAEYGENVVQQAIDDYLKIDSGAAASAFLSVKQLIAIAFRIDRQYAERAAEAEKARQAEAERRAAASLIDAHRGAAKSIQDMSDEDVWEIWRNDVLPTYGQSGPARDWAEAWDIEKVRTNRRLQLRIAGKQMV